MFEQARLTAELFFPDTPCPQGRLKKLTWPERPVQGREALAINPHDACGRPSKSAMASRFSLLLFVVTLLRSSYSIRLHATDARPRHFWRLNADVLVSVPGIN